MKSTYISPAVPITVPNITTIDHVSAPMLMSLCSCADVVVVHLLRRVMPAT